MRSTEKAIPILLIFLFGIAGVGVSLAFSDFLRKEPEPQPEFTTRFYVLSESEMVFGRPAFYRVIIENQEGMTVDYDLQVKMSAGVVYSQKIRLNSSDSLNQTISFIPNQTGDYAKLEFVLYKNNEPYRTRVFQVYRANDYNFIQDSIVTPISPQNTDNISREFTENYSKQVRGNIIIYTFNTGEKLELKVSNDVIGIEDAVYTTANKGNDIIFLGEKYEKLVPITAKYINKIIINASDMKLKVNDTLNLKNNYSVTLNSIDNSNLKFTISMGKKILREIISHENSPAEYWKEIDDYRKQKMIRIIPRNIDQNGIVFDLIQYGGDKVVEIGDRYEEFHITEITEDSIILKNIQYIKIQPGQELSLVKGQIKIKV